MTTTKPIPAEFEEFLRRAKAANLPAAYEEYEEDLYEPEDPGYIDYEARNGRQSRSFFIRTSRVSSFLATNFEDHTFLGDLEATFDRSTGVIEVKIVSSSPTSNIAVRRIGMLPGVAKASRNRSTTEGDVELEESETEAAAWSLKVSEAGVDIEIASVTAEWNLNVYTFPRPVVGMRISGTGETTHDGAYAALMRFGGAFLFELDLLYGISVQFARKRQRISRSLPKKATKPPKFPKNEYKSDALALYNYGRAASNLPLLEFLAYYQALEYFFPLFSHQEASESLRRMLLNPRFDPTDSSTINNLIRTAAPAFRGGTRERDQVKSALIACLDEAELRDMITKIDPDDKHFTAKKQAIKGVSALRLTGESNLREQVAERIYSIRCRVVHTKQDGGGPGEELLLPTGPEASSLLPEIMLLRLITQEALVHQAKRQS